METLQKQQQMKKTKVLGYHWYTDAGGATICILLYEDPQGKPRAGISARRNESDTELDHIIFTIKFGAKFPVLAARFIIHGDGGFKVPRLVEYEI